MIRTEHLGCGYGRCEVLHDINITMNPGELWCVLGANGVGKSTLFKTLLGLLKPMSGQILIQDKPLEQWSRKELSRLVPMCRRTTYRRFLLRCGRWLPWDAIPIRTVMEG